MYIRLILLFASISYLLVRCRATEGAKKARSFLNTSMKVWIFFVRYSRKCHEWARKTSSWQKMTNKTAAAAAASNHKMNCTYFSYFGRVSNTHLHIYFRWALNLLNDENSEICSRCSVSFEICSPHAVRLSVCSVKIKFFFLRISYCFC